MDEDELVHGLVNNLTFEIEAIPADNVVKFTSTNGTPLNVKVRVRNKDEPRLVQRGILSVPKLVNQIASLDKIRLISSDQTILSFNVYMETELEKKSPPKSRKHGFNFFKFGGCLGTSYDDDEGPYLPGPSNKKALKSRTSSKSDSDIRDENRDVAEKLKLNLKTSKAATRNQKKLFGKCKPGGCLDPPFEEDKEPYGLPKTNPQIKLKQTSNKVEENKSIRISSAEPGKSSKPSNVPTTLVCNEPNKNVVEPKALLDIYARSGSLDNSQSSNYSNAIITNSPKMSYSKMPNQDSNDGNKINKTFNDDSLNQNYRYPETYFIPPKDVRQHKEEERKYSRERSNYQIRRANDSSNRDKIRQDNYSNQRSVPYIFDVANKNYTDNTNTKIPGQSTKLSKHKGKADTERIKQTLTDLTSNKDNSQKLYEDNRKNSGILLNVPLVTQNGNIPKLIPDYKETSSHTTHSKDVDDGNVQNIPDDVELSIISKNDLRVRKEKSQKQRESLSKDQQSAQISLKDKSIIDEVEIPHKQNLPKDSRNKNVSRKENHEENMEPIELGGILEGDMVEKPESEKIQDLYISPTLENGQYKAKTQNSVPSLDTQKLPQSRHLPSDLDSNLEYNPLQSSYEGNKSIESSLQPNTDLIKNPTNLSLATHLQPVEKLSDVNNTNKKSSTTPGTILKEDQANLNSQSKYADKTLKSTNRKISQDKTNEVQQLEDNKKICKNPNLLESGTGEDTIRKSLSYVSDELPENHIKRIKNGQNDNVQETQIKNVAELEKIQKPFVNIEEHRRKTVDDSNLKDIHKNNFIPSTDNQSLRNSTALETNDITLQEKLNNPDSKDTLNNDVNLKYKLENSIDSDNNKNAFQDTMGFKTFDKQKLEKHNYKTTKNDKITGLSNSEIDSGQAIPAIQDPAKKITTYRDNVKKSDLENVSFKSNKTDLSSLKTLRPNDITTVTSFQMQDDLEKFQKQSQGSKHAKKVINNYFAASLANDLQADDKEQLLTANKSDNRSSERQPIDATVKNLSADSVRNSLHDHILKTGVELIKPSTSVDSSQNLSSHPKKQEHYNINITDGDDFIIKNGSLHDENKSLNINDRMASAVLQKTPLIANDETDLHNDDINIIKPFKRNTFTTVESSTSLQKHQEEIWTQQPTNKINEYSKTERDKQNISNEQCFDAQNDQKRDNGFEVESNQETRNFITLLNPYAYDNKSLEKYDQSRERNREIQNTSRVSGSKNHFVPENVKSDNTEVMSNKIYQNVVTTEDDEKPSSASNLVSNDMNMVNTEIVKSQEPTVTKDKLFLNVKPSDSSKKISQFKEKSEENDFGKIHLETNVGIVPHTNESLENHAINDTFSGPTGNTKTTPNTEYLLQIRPDSSSLVITEESFTNEISDIPINSGRNYDVLTANPIKDTKDETSHEKSETNPAHIVIEYEAGLLANAKIDSELEEPRYSLFDTLQSTEAAKSDENTYEVLSIQKSGKADDRNAESDLRAILTKEQSVTQVDENGEFIKISDSEIARNLNKIIDKNQLIPKDGTKYYGVHDSITKVDADGDLHEISDSNTRKNFNMFVDNNTLTPNDGTYYNKFDDVAKVREVDALRKISDRDKVGSINKGIDKKPLKLKDDTGLYSEYTSSPQASVSINDSSNIKQSGTRINTTTMKGDQLINLSDPIILNQKPASAIYNQNENEKRLNRTNLEEKMSSPVEKDKSEVIFLNLALQSYVNDTNETVVQTLNPLAEPLRYKGDTVTVVQSLIRNGNEIRIPVDIENDLSLKFMSKNQKNSQDANNTGLYEPKKAFMSRNLSEHAHLSAKHQKDVNKSLAFIYESELIPLHNIIKNLTEEINTLSAQQELLKDKLRSTKRTRSLRLIPVIKRCGCGGM